MDFFNDISKRVSTAAKSMQKRTRESVEVGKLNGQMRVLRDQCGKLVASLGEAYYKSVNGDQTQDQMDFIVEQIRQNEAQRAELQKQIDKLNQQKRCPVCGKVVALDARFCSGCGTRIPETPVQAEAAPEPEYCPHCGALREDDSPFCSSCGKPFDGETEEEAAEPAEAAVEETMDSGESAVEIKWPQAEDAGSAEEGDARETTGE